ncbi:YncE family protein [Geoalkalibacter subterraneus]|uniref:YncE family protein n=1 Tax=Geoalkalibacter subterraneus TaxID=483547 RepID=UPI001186922B|nr:YncE family protein [Geoalkalibacter subterraneus]
MYLPRILFVLWAIFTLTGCLASSPGRSAAPSPDQALTTTYLSHSGPSTVDTSFVLDDFALQSEGEWVQLGIESVTVDSKHHRAPQRALGLASLPPADYAKIRFRLSRLKVGRSVIPPSEDYRIVELTLSEPLRLEATDSKCLFLDWYLAVDENGGAMTPVFKAWGQGQTLGGDLLFAACDQINTIYVIRSDINEVVASFGIPGPLGEIAVASDKRRLHVLSTGERSIFTFDALNLHLIDRIPLSRTMEPRHLVLSEDARYAFVSDAATGQVLKIDLASGHVAQQIRIGHRPERIAYGSGSPARIAVVAPRSQQVFILDANSLRTRIIVSVGMNPTSALFFAGDLYVAEQASQTVSIYEEASGRQQSSINVGFQPDYLLALSDRKVLVSNAGEQSLSVLVPDQATSFRTIRAGSNPTTLAKSETRQLLYVANRSKNRITVIDLASEKIEQEIELGGMPFSLAVLD